MPRPCCNYSTLPLSSQEEIKAVVADALKQPDGDQTISDFFVPISSPTSSRKDNKVGNSNRKNAVLSGDFIRDFRAYALTAHAPADLRALVAYVSKHNPLPLSSGYQPANLPHSGKPARRLKWRQVEDEAQALLAFIGLSLQGRRIVRVDANLRHDVEEEARAKPGGPMDWLRRGVAENLDYRLKRKVDFILSLEETLPSPKQDNPYRLHMHLLLVIDEPETERARKALKAVAGNYDDAHQVRFNSEKVDLRGAGYIAKQIYRSRPGYRAFMRGLGADRRRIASFDGPALSMTNGALHAAQEMHELFRTALKDSAVRAAIAATRPVLGVSMIEDMPEEITKRWEG